MWNNRSHFAAALAKREYLDRRPGCFSVIKRMFLAMQNSRRELSRLHLCSLFFIAAFLFPPLAYGNSDYYRHIYFDNSLTSDFYFYSSGHASSPSSLEQKNWKLPVETKVFLTPPNA